MVKKISVSFLVVLLIAGLMYALVYFIIIPVTATALIPLKWKNISPGQKKESYLMYLGRPDTNNNFPDYREDLWSSKKGNYNFYLNMHYDTDTIAKFVRIYYKFHNDLFEKTENLVIDSL